MCRVDGMDSMVDRHLSEYIRGEVTKSGFKLKYYCKKMMTPNGFCANLAAKPGYDRLNHGPSYLDPEPKGACGIML